MNKRIKQLLISISLIASIGSAQTIKLRLEEALQIGLEKSKAIHASLMKVQAADAKVSETFAGRLPSLKLGATYTRLSKVDPFTLRFPYNGTLLSDGSTVVFNSKEVAMGANVVNNYNAKLTLQQPIFTGFKLSNASDIAEYSAKAASQDYDKDKGELIYNIKNAYWNLFKAIEMKKVVDENVDQMKAHVRDVQNLQVQGLVTNNDVLKVQVQLSDAQLRQIDMKNTVQIAVIALNSTLGLPLSTDIEPVSAVKTDSRQFAELTSLLQQAYDRRPELKAMEYRVKASESGVSLARGGWWPQLFLVGNYTSARPNQRVFPSVDKFKDTWDVSLSLSMDIWNWGTTVHQTDQAQAQLAQAEDGLSQLKDGVALDVTRNYLNIGRSKERISVAETGVKQADENYRMTSAKFKQGLALNSDLLDAEVALLQAKTNFTQALVDYELAEAALVRSIGE